jgi:hypothetical protein
MSQSGRNEETAIRDEQVLGVFGLFTSHIVSSFVGIGSYLGFLQAIDASESACSYSDLVQISHQR